MLTLCSFAISCLEIAHSTRSPLRASCSFTLCLPASHSLTLRLCPLLPHVPLPHTLLPFLTSRSLASCFCLAFLVLFCLSFPALLPHAHLLLSHFMLVCLALSCPLSPRVLSSHPLLPRACLALSHLAIVSFALCSFTLCLPRALTHSRLVFLYLALSCPLSPHTHFPCALLPRARLTLSRLTLAHLALNHTRLALSRLMFFCHCLASHFLALNFLVSHSYALSCLELSHLDLFSSRILCARLVLSRLKLTSLMHALHSPCAYLHLPHGLSLHSLEVRKLS